MNTHDLSGYIYFRVKKTGKRANIEQDFNKAMLEVGTMIGGKFPGVEIETSSPILSQILAERLKHDRG